MTQLSTAVVKLYSWNFPSLKSFYASIYEQQARKIDIFDAKIISNFEIKCAHIKIFQNIINLYRYLDLW